MTNSLKRLFNDKTKVYALFQFASLTFVFSLLATLFAIVVNTRVLASSTNGAGEPYATLLGYDVNALFSFSYDQAADRFASVFAYASIFALIFSWACGAMIIRFKRRTIYDMLFVLFFFIPLLANIIALLAQLNRLKATTELPLDEQAIYDQTWAELTSAKTSQDNLNQLDEQNNTLGRPTDDHKRITRRRK